MLIVKYHPEFVSGPVLLEGLFSPEQMLNQAQYDNGQKHTDKFVTLPPFWNTNYIALTQNKKNCWMPENYCR